MKRKIFIIALIFSVLLLIEMICPNYYIIYFIFNVIVVPLHL